MQNINNFGHSGGCFPISIDLKSPDSADLRRGVKLLGFQARRARNLTA